MDRRKFLKGAVALPVVAALPAIAGDDISRWSDFEGSFSGPEFYGTGMTPIWPHVKGWGPAKYSTGPEVIWSDLPEEYKKAFKAFDDHYDNMPEPISRPFFNNQ